MPVYEISIGGRGCEMAIGKISQVAYEFWITQDEEAVHDHLFWDAYDNETSNPVYDDTDERFMGDWWDNDDVEHLTGALEDYLYVEVTDESGKVIWTTDSVDYEVTDAYNMQDLDTGYYIKTWSNEKGQFYVASFETEQFDPSKLKFYATNIDGDVFVNSLTYDGSELDEDGGNTTGKGYDYEFYCVE